MQEREGKLGSMPHSRASGADRAAKAHDIGGTQIRQFASLQVAPEQFNRVEVGRVCRKRFDVEPLALRGQVSLHATAFVGTESIPDQHDPLTAEMALERAHEADEAGIGVGGRTRLKVQPGPTPIPSKRQGRGDRQPFPVAAKVAQHGRPPAGRPRAPHHRLL